jgi:DAACS family dicarboxylate/amino acid:cation (Na+ or H+) symporter
MPLHTRILIGLAVGVLGGIAANLTFGPSDANVQWTVENITNPVGQLFLRLLLMTVVPLVFSSLVAGVAGIGDIRKLGRVGLKSFAYTFAISAVSVIIALTVANVIAPGKKLDADTATALQARYGGDAAARVASAQAANKDAPFLQVIKTIVPSNPIAAAAADPPNMLHIMFFALVLGVAITLVPNHASEPVINLMDGLFAISTKIIELIMYVAPIAVACLLFSNVASFGLDLLGALVWYMATVLIGLGLHLFGVYSLSLKFLSNYSPIEFFRRTKTVALTAFATSSSNATLPTALRVGEKELGIPREINSFVLTVGATANQNGTALYEGVTVLFLAQLAGVDLTIGQQIVVSYMAILGGIGTAGVPSGSIPFIVVVLATVGVNPALIAIILGVDRILDMCRTTLNVVGDLTAATYVAHSEGHELLKS